MSFLRDAIWGSPEARRRKKEQKEKRERAYHEGLAQAQLEREERQIKQARMRGYEYGSSTGLERAKNVLVSVGKGTKKTGKLMSKSVKAVVAGMPKLDTTEDPFGLFPKKHRKKRKR